MPATDGIWRITALRSAARRWPIGRRAFAALDRYWGKKSPARRSSPADELKAEDADLVLQQLSRVRTKEGTEAIHGTLVAEFNTGQREATLHVAFCPPFEHLPEVDAFIADNSAATVKLAQRLHQGAQFEVRLSRSANRSCNVRIEFFASGPKADQ